MSTSTPPTTSTLPTDRQPLAMLRKLTKDFPIKSGLLQRTHGHVHAVDNVDLTIDVGQSVGLVGESGSGKSTLGRLMLRLIEPTSGTVTFEDTDVTRLKGDSLRRLRRHMQMVFQDPYSSMDPRSYVGDAVAEPLQSQLGMKGSELDDRVAELFRLVGLSPSYRGRFPHEFSGGQLQRLAVARAIATHPRLVVCDEPVSSLDVSTRAEVINLLSDLQDELGIAYLFIAHDLGVVRHVSDRIAVMYLGRIVEEGDAEVVYSTPRHPYTQALLSAIPVPDPTVQRGRDRVVLEGDLPSPANPPSGCHFHTRCPYVMDVCRVVDPPVAVMPDGTRVFCHLHPPTEASTSTNGSAATPLSTN
jgi:oligopeptide transport system ATP-binding protein